ncbi:uncharacterized protein KY384_008285 [Bacidia gigantensis]|uniref:uncharacterized protein n=1 Tax=Bacidia gigantensis TaxID=2732470 RepID=UPI001D055A1D|nr:uncharacterized protein KY384_008285 [Bacidia gigantensis]KAG8526856.1 hypothetical protein KY384_008285 [Bacidia gigantensis]
MASLADRITKPDADMNSSSWADESTNAANASSATGEEVSSTENRTSSLAEDQTDGAPGHMGGSSGILEPTYDVDVKLSDLQADPNDPLYSAKSFEELGLNENILKGIYQMRFTKPSKIQERALPLLLKDPPTNMIGQSQSGTGKTAAFVLNILSRIDISQKDSPQGLVLAPSRELARQILGVIQVMGQFMEGLIVDAAIPVDAANRKRFMTAHIVVGTPGTVTDLIRRRQMDPRNIKVLVLDEADNMLDQQGLGDQCHRVRQSLPANIQVLLFSATFPNHVVEFAARFAPNSNQITLRHEELTVDGIKQLYLDCPSEGSKYDALVKLYGLMTIGSSIIFVRTRETALAIERRLNEENHKVACLTGAFEPGQRDIIIDAFRTGQAKVLITTNVLSRGIDVQTVSLVINYVSALSHVSLARVHVPQDLPDDGRGNADPQVYLHRIGRTGRFGRVGVSISLIHGRKSYQMIQQIRDYFGVDMTALPHDDWDMVENMIKKVIKSSRAGSNFKTLSDHAIPSLVLLLKELLRVDVRAVKVMLRGFRTSKRLVGLKNDD